MKFITPTFKKYPARTADAIYGMKLSQALQSIMGDDFLLIVIKNEGDELKGIHTKTISLRGKHFRFWKYFIQLLVFVLKSKKDHKQTIFFSNDYTLMSILIILRKVFFFKYKLCVDWHMLSEGWKDSFMARYADLHITTTQKLKDLIVSNFNTKEDTILVAYGGVDETLFTRDENKQQYRTILGLPQEKFLIGYVGFFKTLGMEKGIKTMINALPFLDEKYTMVFVGGKQEEIALYSEKAKEKGVFERCIFVGVISQDQIALYQKSLDVLAIPYPRQPHFEKYGFPMKTYEYMLTGNPIVYSDLDILHEVLQGCGFSFKADNAEDFAGVVKHINDSQDEVRLRTEISYEKAKNLTWRKKGETIINFINDNVSLD